MALANETTGAGRRLVLAHGFTQNRRCWGPFGDQLAAGHELVLVDMPGHGNTDPNHDSADLPTSAELLVESGGEATYVGYSMGGRVALHAALQHPAAVQGLVLIGATAGIDDAPDRRDRRLADDALADELIEIGLDAFLDRWLAGPLFASLTDAAACRDARRSNRVDGLAASLRRCGTGTQEPLWDRLSTITAPVLVLAGANDAKFTELGGRLVDALAKCPAPNHRRQPRRPARGSNLNRLRPSGPSSAPSTDPATPPPRSLTTFRCRPLPAVDVCNAGARHLSLHASPANRFLRCWRCFGGRR